MITIVLMEPENAGNLGAICRSMKNFALSNLLIINPKCNPLSEEAKKRAKHANDLLKKATIRKSVSALKKFDYLVATTSQLGTDYNIPRSPINPENLAEIIKGKKANIAILIGREGKGLSNEEIMLCDFVVTIETDKNYPTMNASHAATVLFYELHKFLGKEKIGEQIIVAGKPEKDQTLKMIGKVLNTMTFTTKEKKQTQKIVWKRILGKSFLTKRESFALMGFFRKMIKKDKK